MEQLPMDLKSLIEKRRKRDNLLSERELCKIALPFLYELKKFHSNGIFHSDIKIENLLLKPVF